MMEMQMIVHSKHNVIQMKYVMHVYVSLYHAEMVSGKQERSVTSMM